MWRNQHLRCGSLASRSVRALLVPIVVVAMALFAITERTAAAAPSPPSTPSTPRAPTVSDATTVTGPGSRRHPDVAFDGTNFFVVWQQKNATTGWDVYGR